GELRAVELLEDHRVGEFGGWLARPCRYLGAEARGSHVAPAPERSGGVGKPAVDHRVRPRASGLMGLAVGHGPFAVDAVRVVRDVARAVDDSGVLKPPLGIVWIDTFGVPICKFSCLFLGETDVTSTAANLADEVAAWWVAITRTREH